MKWTERSLLIGMPHMVPEQLSEVELLKHLGDIQWQGISEILELPSPQIVNDHGERLYASFINIDVNFTSKTPMDLGEGTSLHVLHSARMYSRRFMEGFFCFDNAPIPASMTAGIETREDLGSVSVPWVYLTNVFVTRDESNLKLRTFAPVGNAPSGEFATEITPPGIRDHETVEAEGTVTLAGMDTARPVTCAHPEKIAYEVVPESDLNGAGLLYFARYVAVANYAERQFLRRHSDVEITSRLVRFLTPVRRRIFYFANASEHETIEMRVSAFVSRPLDGRFASTTSVTPLQMFFSTDLRRRSDGALMAKSVVQKVLKISKGMKGLMLDAGRVERELGL